MFEVVSLLSICLVIVLLCNCIFNLCSHFYNCDEKKTSEIKGDMIFQ